MKIIYHHRTQGEEPESIHITAIVDSFRALGHVVEVVGPSARDLNTAGSNAGMLAKIKNRMPGLLFEAAQVFYNIVVFFRLWRWVAKVKPDFIYERYALYSFAGVLLSKVLNIPLILEVNTPYAHAWAKYYKVYFPKLAEAVEKWMINNALTVFTVTEAQKAFLAGLGINPSHISVCHNAINPTDFEDVLDRCEEFGFAEHEIIVGFVGTMNRWQGIPIFKDVIPEILKTYSDVKFLLVGDGEFREDLETFLEHEGLANRVVFTGRVAHSEVPSLLALINIAVLPNSNDYGSPMKVFEYAAVGAAMVVPSVGPVKEVLVENETALFISPGSAGELRDCIKRLIEDEKLREYIGGNAKRYVLENHTWLENARKIIHSFCARRDAI